MPMGFCYSKRPARGGDEPPRPKCVPAGHDRVLAELPKLKRALLVELYAQGYYLGDRPEKLRLQQCNLTDLWPDHHGLGNGAAP